MDSFRTNYTQVLETAYQLGIHYFDTAPGYGLAEQWLIDWIQDVHDLRLEVATKWGYTYVAGFNADAEVHEIKEHSLDKLNEQWRISQQLLPFLTTYQIHSATFESGVLEKHDVLNRLAELKNSKQLKIGLSTSGANQLEVVRKALDIVVAGEPLFDVFQVSYNVLDQSLSEILKEKIASEKRFVIKEALANGRIFPSENYPQYQQLYESLERLSNKYRVGLDAIALRFCIDSFDPFVVLSGASNSQQLIENVKCNDFSLEEDELELLRNLQVDPEMYWGERKKLKWN